MPDFDYSTYPLIGHQQETRLLPAAMRYYSKWGANGKTLPLMAQHAPDDILLEDNDIEAALRGAAGEVTRVTFHQAEVYLAVLDCGVRRRIGHLVLPEVLRTCYVRPTIYTLERVRELHERFTETFNSGRFSAALGMTGFGHARSWMESNGCDRFALMAGLDRFEFTLNEKVFPVWPDDLLHKPRTPS